MIRLQHSLQQIKDKRKAGVKTLLAYVHSKPSERDNRRPAGLWAFTLLLAFNFQQSTSQQPPCYPEKVSRVAAAVQHDARRHLSQWRCNPRASDRCPRRDVNCVRTLS